MAGHILDIFSTYWTYQSVRALIPPIFILDPSLPIYASMLRWLIGEVSFQGLLIYFPHSIL
jgi:hypothetical protein